MADLAASDPSSPGAHEALRDVAFHADKVDDRNVALNASGKLNLCPRVSHRAIFMPLIDPVSEALGRLSAFRFGKFIRYMPSTSVSIPQQLQK